MTAITDVDAIKILIRKIKEKNQPWCRVQSLVYEDAEVYCSPDKCIFSSPIKTDEDCARNYQYEVC